MLFSRSLLLLAALFTTSALTAPTDSTSFADVEKRWSEGESEVCLSWQPGCYIGAWVHSLSRRAQIHAAHTHRDATPSWRSIRRNADPEAHAFPAATDERTLAARSRSAPRPRDVSKAITAQMRAFAANFLRTHGEKELIEAREATEESAPVLKPRRGMRYSFTA